jgi:hypothetical protein
MARSIGAAIGTVDRDAALTFRPLTEQINASLAQERILDEHEVGEHATAPTFQVLGAVREC